MSITDSDSCTCCSFAVGVCKIRANGSVAAAALPLGASQGQETASPAVLQQRIDQLDADIVNVSSLVKLQSPHPSSGGYITDGLAWAQIQRILLLHSEQLERLSKAELSPRHCGAANGRL